MRVVVKKWGNSASLRIPNPIMQAARLRLDQAVDVREEAGRIVVEPLPEQNTELQQLLDGITDDNLHGETETGPPVGREFW